MRCAICFTAIIQSIKSNCACGLSSFICYQSGDTTFSIQLDSLNNKRDFKRAKPPKYHAQSCHPTTKVAHYISTVEGFTGHKETVDSC